MTKQEDDRNTRNSFETSPDMEIEKLLYRGIVLVGSPGSGKTTIARELTKSLPNSFYCEASQVVIKPAIRLGQLPDTAEQFISSALSSPDTPVNIDRDKGRETFVALADKYGADIIARTLIANHELKERKKLLILGGIRGKENVAYFKKQGYFIAFLDVSESTIIQRMIGGRGLTEEAARRDYFEEEKLYQTPSIKEIAQLVIPEEFTPEAASAKIVKRLHKKELQIDPTGVEPS